MATPRPTPSATVRSVRCEGASTVGPGVARMTKSTQGDSELLMTTSTRKRRATRAAAVIAAGGLAIPLLLSTSGQADPRQHTNQVVGTGSDTTQEVLNALAGQADDDYYTPVHSDASFGSIQISSWDAVAPGDPNNTLTCISPRAGFNAIQRPNGSSQGRDALSRSFDGQPWHANSPTGDPACDDKSTSGIVNFARSSSGNSGATTELTYIPFAKDALTYAFTYVDGVAGDAGDAASNGFADLTFSELQSIFQGPGTGSTIRTRLVVPCDIQHGSGTQKDWPGKVGGGTTAGQIDAASDRCDALGSVGVDPQRLQESKPSQLEAKADLFEAANPGQVAMLVVGHSVSNYIAQANGASPAFLHPDVTLGSAVTGQPPFTGVAPNLVPNASFYNATPASPGVTPGRFVYNVLLTDLVTGPGEAGIKSLFIGTTAKICQATTVIQAFGFALLDPANPTVADRCGDTSRKGSLVDA